MKVALLLLLLLSHFSCVQLCDPIDGSPPGSSVPGILQARTLEWVAISFSSAWKWKVKGKSLSHVRLLATPWTAACQAPLCPWNSPGQNTAMSCHFLLQSRVKLPFILETTTHQGQRQEIKFFLWKTSRGLYPFSVLTYQTSEGSWHLPLQFPHCIFMKNGETEFTA